MKTLMLAVLAVVIGSTLAFSSADKRRCNKKPDAGRCRESIEKYYYHNATDRCEVFLYTGCGGNDNQFDSDDDCTRECHRMRLEYCPEQQRETLERGEANCSLVDIMGTNGCYKTYVNCPTLNINPTDMKNFEVPSDCKLRYLKRPGKPGVTIIDCNNEQN